MPQSRMAVITFFDEGNYPSQGLPGGPPAYPSQGLPPTWGGGHPSQGLPGGGHISLLPVFPFDPTLSPDNSLPGQQPEAGNELPRPGKKYVVKWLACSGLILVPDNTLPSTPEPK